MTDEAKTPGADAAGDGEIIEMPPDSARVDPWAGDDDAIYITPRPPLTREQYDYFDLKDEAELDTYGELASQWDAVKEETRQHHAQQLKREKADEEEEKIEDFRDTAEDLKDSGGVLGAFGGTAHQAAEERLAEMEVEPEPVDTSTLSELSKDGVTLDPGAAAFLRKYEDTDTYEELEAYYKDALVTRDEYLMDNYESQQREVVEEAAENVGESLGGFVEQIPFAGDAAEDVVNLAVEGAEEWQANSLTESEEANIEMHPPENDPGMVE